MLRFQKIILSFCLTLAAVLTAEVFFDVHSLVYAAVIAVPLIILAWGSVYVCSGIYIDSLCHAKNKGRVLALTFDDGPDKNTTPLILDILKENGIRAAFFCKGEMAEKEPELIRRIDSEGHIIGNHSYSHHFFFDFFREKTMTNDVQRSRSVIFDILGKKMKLFRPPYGVTNPVLARVLRKSDYNVIGWSLKSRDTVIISREKLMRRLEGNIKAGDFILFHDDRNHTAGVLRDFIALAKKKNYRFERPDRLLNVEAYE